LIADDAAGDESGDLAEHDLTGAVVDGDEVLLVLRGGIFAAGDEELTRLIANFLDGPADRRAVDVDVEDIPESAYGGGAFPVGRDGNHFAVGGRDGNRAGGNFALGVAEKPEAERRQEVERKSPRPREQVADEEAAREQSERVGVAVNDHVWIYFYSVT